MRPHNPSPKKKTALGGLKPDSIFKIVTVYEDRPLGKRAKETCDRMASRLGRDCEVKNSFWNFSVLQDPIAKAFAARDAVDADMIVIATHEELELPSQIRSWVEKWFCEKEGRPGALVALLGRSADDGFQVVPVHSYLQCIAEEAGMDFFPIQKGAA